MRILRIACRYRRYPELFYQRHPELGALSFAEQYRIVKDDCFAWADAWTRALTPLGHEVWEPMLYAEVMQRTWAREQGLPAESLSLHQIAIQQAKHFKPDVVWCSWWDWSTDALQELKRAAPSIRLLVVSVGGALPPDRLSPAVDLVLSCMPELVQELRAAGARAELLSHAFYTRVLELLPWKEPAKAVTFIGSISQWAGMHGQREALLAELAKNLPMVIYSPDFASYATTSNVRTSARCFLYDLVHGPLGSRIPKAVLSRIPLVRGIARWPVRPRGRYATVLGRIMRPGIWGLEAYAGLQTSRLSLNFHPDLSHTYASNMRLFEATGVKTCLVTDWKQNLKEFFEPDREVVAYSNTAECVEKLCYLLDHESERRAIAEAGQRRALREHTFEHRAPILDQIMRGYIPRRAHAAASESKQS
jgi:spore maturation protein CgeB